MLESDSAQMRLPFSWSAPSDESHKPAVLDLFSGIGGIALGFNAAGFRVTGVDVEELSAETFAENAIGEHLLRDLSRQDELRKVDVVVGGPPCRPWSAVNQQRRGALHGDHKLLERFFRHVAQIRPYIFLMENVPPLAGDPGYLDFLKASESYGYSIARQLVRYSDFGVPSTRTRLFTVGIRDSSSWTAPDFFTQLSLYHREQQTVRDAIGWVQATPRGGFPDHEWSQLKSIENYKERYRTGQYGWKQLAWEEPAPSFGSVSKTYILHPDAGIDGFPLRVLSVREVLSILGFSRSFRFPPMAPLGKRYRMVANAVSPVVSEACARVIRRILGGPGTLEVVKNATS